jgi:hypothetical protein
MPKIVQPLQSSDEHSRAARSMAVMVVWQALQEYKCMYV